MKASPRERQKHFKGQLKGLLQVFLAAVSNKKRKKDGEKKNQRRWNCPEYTPISPSCRELLATAAKFVPVTPVLRWLRSAPAHRLCLRPKLFGNQQKPPVTCTRWESAHSSPHFCPHQVPGIDFPFLARPNPQNREANA